MTFISLFRAAGHVLLLMFFVAGPVHATGVAGEQSELDMAKSIVAETGAALQAIVSNAENTSKADRLQALTNVLRANFDMERVGANIIGKENYGKWTPEQRDAYVAGFIRYILATNDKNIQLFEADDFRVLDASAMPRGFFEVLSEYRIEGQDPVHIGFVVGTKDGKWLIMDVQESSAISLLEVKRAELNSVLQRKGFDGMIELMNKIADKMIAD